MSKAPSNGAKLLPHLIGAFFCEKTLQEADGVLSAIRIVDLVQIPPLPKGARKRFVLPNLIFVLMLRAGNRRGKVVCELYMVNPSGKRIKIGKQEIPDIGDSPEKGINAVIPAAFKWDKPGLYWFEVYVEGKRLTRSPMVIKLLPVKEGQEGKKPKA
jgi:hypothetical protein